MEVEFLDSHEVAAQRLPKAMEAANAKVAPWQVALRVGDCILSIVEDGQVVFGRGAGGLPGAASEALPALPVLLSSLPGG